MMNDDDDGDGDGFHFSFLFIFPHTMSGTGGLSYESMQTPLELSPLKTQIIFFRKWMQNT